MKLYKKLVRPMIQPPALQGFNSSPYPFDGEGTYWYDENLENNILDIYTKRLKDPMSRVVFDERYVEIEIPEPEVLKWIPVSKELPEENIHVLCQFYLGGMGECYLAHGMFHVVGGVVMTCNEVIAWMPLPQPYNAESEGQQ